jgi:hypothetical protein
MLRTTLFCCSLVLLLLAGCRIQLSVPTGGTVTNQAGQPACGSTVECTIEVDGYGFSDTYTANPDQGQLFAGWQKGHRRLCGGRLNPCALDASVAAGVPVLEALVESDEAFYLSPQFLPEDQLRRYVAGDRIRFEGELSVAEDGQADVVSTAVVGHMVIRDTTEEEAGYSVLAAELTLADESGQVVYTWSGQFWQDDHGGIYLRTDHYGNLLLDTASNSTGIPSVPVPLEPQAVLELPFSAMWGGHTSGPLTSGNRRVETGDPQSMPSPAGEVTAYPVRIVDEYSYLISYVDFNRDDSVVDESLLWMSQEKGLVRLEFSHEHYNHSGALLRAVAASLDAVGFSF